MKREDSNWETCSFSVPEGRREVGWELVWEVGLRLLPKMRQPDFEVELS